MIPDTDGPPDDVEPGTGVRRGVFLLACAFAAGVLVYLTTRSLIAGALLPSVSAGWAAVRTGFWVLRYDPSAVRRRVGFLFYVSDACWLAAAAAFAAVVGFAVTAHIIGRPPDMDRFGATMLVLVAGVGSSTLIGLTAIGTALRRGTRVWIDPKLPRRLTNLERFGDRPGRNGFNHAMFVIATSVTVPTVVLLGMVVVLLSADGAPAAQVEGSPPALLALLALLGSPVVLVFAYSWISSRIVAASPFECWPLQVDRDAPSEGS